MIVVDASVFIDLVFEYNSERTHYAEVLFSLLEEMGLTILEPDLFKGGADGILISNDKFQIESAKRSGIEGISPSSRQRDYQETAG